MGHVTKQGLSVLAMSAVRIWLSVLEKRLDFTSLVLVEKKCKDYHDATFFCEERATSLPGGEKVWYVLSHINVVHNFDIINETPVCAWLKICCFCKEFVTVFCCCCAVQCSLGIQVTVSVCTDGTFVLRAYEMNTIVIVMMLLGFCWQKPVSEV